MTKPAAGNTPDVVILETDVTVVQQKNYDLMGDLLEADVLMIFRQVLRDEESVVKVGGQSQFGYLPRMALANIGTMNSESFCERILSCPFVKEYCLVPVWLSLIYILPSTMRR